MFVWVQHACNNIFKKILWRANYCFPLQLQATFYFFISNLPWTWMSNRKSVLEIGKSQANTLKKYILQKCVSLSNLPNPCTEENSQRKDGNMCCSLCHWSATQLNFQESNPQAQSDSGSWSIQYLEMILQTWAKGITWATEPSRQFPVPTIWEIKNRDGFGVSFWQVPRQNMGLCICPTTHLIAMQVGKKGINNKT